MRAYTLKEQWDKLTNEKKWEEYLRVVANIDDLVGNTADPNPKGWECVHCGEDTHGVEYDYLASPTEHLSCVLGNQLEPKKKNRK